MQVYWEVRGVENGDALQSLLKEQGLDEKTVRLENHRKPFNFKDFSCYVSPFVDCACDTSCMNAIEHGVPVLIEQNSGMKLPLLVLLLTVLCFFSLHLL